MNDIIKVLLIMGGLFVFLVLVASSIGELYEIDTGSIAIVPIEGEITSFGTITSDNIIDWLDTADADPNVKAIILKINSPGGTVVATDEISEKIRSIEKPVIAWIRDMGASGAYWIASDADVIIANRMSITGSIGVSASYLEFSELFEKYGIDYIKLVSAPQKDTGSPFREPESKELEKIKREIQVIHKEFVEHVAKNRNVSKSVIERTEGGILLGYEAYDLGLVDYLGNKPMVEEVVKNITDMADISYVSYKPELDIFDMLTQFSGQSIFPKEELKINAV